MSGPVVRALPAAAVLSSGIRGAALGTALRPGRMTAEDVVTRLEAAGSALLALPARGYSTQLRQMKFDIVHTALEAYGWQSAMARAPVPSAGEISRMDEAFGWLALIPEGQYVLRRIVGARALVHPLTGRHLFAWRRLAATLGADHKSIQRWRAQGIEMLVKALADLVG
jgi:hypothetical protein